MAGAGGTSDRDGTAANDGARHMAGAAVVMGVSGSGKSTLGRLLAMRLACSFVEGDALHAPSSIAKMRAGQSLDDADRWPWLDRIGAALRAAVAADGAAVAACSALKFSYRERLRQALAAPLRFILLDAARDELARRLAGRPGHFMPASLLDSQLATLEQPRAGESVLVLDARLPPEALCEAGRDWLRGSGSGPS